MTKYEAITQIRSLTQASIEKAENLFDIKFPEIEIDCALTGRCAGMACYTNGYLTGSPTNLRLRFNVELARENWEEFLTTIPHEVCHLVVVMTHPRGYKPHGPEWKMAMRLMGEEPEARHTMEQPKEYFLKSRPFVYTCGCAEHHISPRINKQMNLGQRRTCRKCKQFLVFSHDMRITDKTATIIPMPKLVPVIKKVACLSIMLTVNDICKETSFDAKKVRRILRKNADNLPTRSGKAWEFDMSDKETVLNIF